MFANGRPKKNELNGPIFQGYGKLTVWLHFCMQVCGIFVIFTAKNRFIR